MPAERPLDVLIMDDEDLFADACRRTLEEAGPSVTTAGSGREGLALAQSAPFPVLSTLKYFRGEYAGTPPPAGKHV